jgi:hypothetical protein
MGYHYRTVIKVCKMNIGKVLHLPRRCTHMFIYQHLRAVLPLRFLAGHVV